MSNVCLNIGILSLSIDIGCLSILDASCFFRRRVPLLVKAFQSLRRSVRYVPMC